MSEVPDFFHGFLNTENADMIAELIRKTLAGERFSVVVSAEGNHNFRPTLKTGVRLKTFGAEAPKAWFREDLKYATLRWTDTQSTYTLGASEPDSAAENDKVYVSIADGNIKIEHKNTFKQTIYWVFAIEE